MDQQETDALLERVDEIIERLQYVQREIRASNQPAARYELDELIRLGKEYGSIMERLEIAREQERSKN